MIHPANSPVVVGIDGSDHATDAVRWAAAEAALHHAPLTIAHVMAGDIVYDGMLPPTPAMLDDMRRDGEAMLRAAAVIARQAAGGDISIETVQPEGHPVTKLRDTARGARMLVLGRSGHSRLTGTFWLGSTVEQLATHAVGTVVVVRGRTDLDASAPVVVGVDGSPTSEAALGAAFDEASFRRAPLHALHAWTASYLTTMYPSEPVLVDWEPVADVEERRFAERMAGWGEKYPDVSVTRTMVNDRPTKALREAATGAQLLVVGSRGRGGFTGLMLGSTSQHLIHHADCPVMVVRPDGT